MHDQAAHDRHKALAEAHHKLAIHAANPALVDDDTRKKAQALIDAQKVKPRLADAPTFTEATPTVAMSGSQRHDQT